MVRWGPVVGSLPQALAVAVKLGSCQFPRFLSIPSVLSLGVHSLGSRTSATLSATRTRRVARLNIFVFLYSPTLGESACTRIFYFANFFDRFFHLFFSLGGAIFHCFRHVQINQHISTKSSLRESEPRELTRTAVHLTISAGIPRFCLGTLSRLRHSTCPSSEPRNSSSDR